MVGSSLRNSVHRRNHKERSQLSNRSRLGLLEKKKDYVKRAKDYHSKQDRLRRLQEKAALRNKDEFYFSMTKSKTKEGVHIQERGNVPIPIDVVKLLKTQDANYIRTMRSKELKKIEAIKAELTTLVDLIQPVHSERDDASSSFSDEDDDNDNGLDDTDLKTLRAAGILPPPSMSNKRQKLNISAPLSGKHIVFVQNADEARSYRQQGPSSAPFSSTSKSLSVSQPNTQRGNDDEEGDHLGWKQPVSSAKKGKRKATSLDDPVALDPQKANAIQNAAAKVHRTALLRELSARLARETSLRRAETQLQNQRLRMLNGSKKIVGEGKGRSRNGDDDADEDTGGKGKPFTFNTKADESDSEAEDGGSQKEWKPKVYKWKFERKN